MESSEPFIAESARKHGVADEDILHAWRNIVVHIASDDAILAIGPDRAGNLLEIGSIRSADGAEVVIHAMRARSKHLRG